MIGALNFAPVMTYKKNTLKIHTMNTQFFANYGANFSDLITQFNGLDKNYACPFLALEKLTGKKLHERDVETFQYDFLHELSGEKIKLKNKLYLDITKDIFLPLSINLSKNYKPKNPIKNKGFLSLKNIVGNDELRPISQGVFLNKGDMVATDAHKLVILTGQNSFETLYDISDIHMRTLMKFKGLYEAKNETDTFINNLNLEGLDNKLVNFNTGQLIEDKYYNYPAVIPQYKQEYENRYECSVETILFKIEKAMNTAANFSKNQKNLVFGFDKKNGKTTAVNIKLLADTIYCLAANCNGNMKFYVSDENNRAICIETDNGHFALVMPVVRKNDGYDAHIFVGGIHTYSV
jgi:hypothetical protein